MKKYFKIGGYILLAILLILQFIRPSKNIHTGIQPNNITKLVPINDSLQQLFNVACMDCHSNNTRYPWYANVMPLGWLINNHVVDGKRHFNFDEFTTYKAKRAIKKIGEIAESVETDYMPMENYTYIHKDAKLNAMQKTAIINWAKSAEATLKVLYKDSTL